MTHEQLTQPRYEVMADYPNSTTTIGQVLTASSVEEQEWCNKYPHLFRSLFWWEKIDIDQLPKYIKYNRLDNGELKVCKVLGYVLKNGNDMYAKTENDVLFLDYYDEPATETEYLNYIKSKQ